MNNNPKGLKAIALLLAMLTALLSGCMTEGAAPENQGSALAQEGEAPAIPEKLKMEDGVPVLVVYDVERDIYRQMNMEEYLWGVLAGEMRGDWPMEALKAQAILARTYALKFVQDKESKYSGADISTDIQEAQAYDQDKINERIKKAVRETRGQVISHEGQLPHAWFHAHAGGATELAQAGLDYDKEEPGYTQVIESRESDKAPTTVKNWQAQFTAQQVGEAAAQAGVKTGTVKTIQVGEKGQSGRAVTLVINGKTVSAPSLRLALDSKKMKSTLLTRVDVQGDTVTFEGMGYGHGVGMSQWGAYGMAEQGATAQQIVQHYFKDVQVVSLWD